MNVETIMEALQQEIHNLVIYRDERIAAHCERNISAYQKMAEINRNMELLISASRRILCRYHSEIQSFGYEPEDQPISSPDVPETNIQINEKRVNIIMDGMLPFPLKGGVHFLHEALDKTLLRYSREKNLPAPLFTERCAVVFVHHYAEDNRSLRHLRDYDNVERRCVTNVVARHFLRDDSPACYISMDVLAPGTHNYTEIKIMTIPDFRSFVGSSKIEYLPCGFVSKKT